MLIEEEVEMFNMAIREMKTIFYMYNRRILILLIIPFIFTLTNTTSDFFSFYLLLGGIMVLATPEMDAREKSNILILSAPCKRYEYVLGKFLAMLIWIIGLIISGVIINVLLHSLIPNAVENVKFSTIKLLPAYLILFISIYYFVYFAFSQKVAKVSYYITFIVVMIVMTGASEILERDIFTEKLTWLGGFLNSTSIVNNIIFIGILLAFVGILGTISVAIYEKKDF